MKASVIWAFVALVSIVAAISLGLSFAGWKDQSVIGWTAGIGAFAATVFGLVIKLESKTADQTTQLDQIAASVDTVQQRVNGELDARISAAMEEAAETGAARAIAAMRRDGVIR